MKGWPCVRTIGTPYLAIEQYLRGASVDSNWFLCGIVGNRLVDGYGNARLCSYSKRRGSILYKYRFGKSAGELLDK